MYQAVPDPYCYTGTNILKNRAGHRTQDALDAFEAVMVAQRFEEPLPAGRLSTAHYRAIHRHLFGDVYAWAGRYRSVRISKGGSQFCYPEHIALQMRQLFARLKRDSFLHDRTPEQFAADAAHIIAELNAIHPFREGNGRTQNAFLVLLAATAGHPLALNRLDPALLLQATIISFGGNERPLRQLIMSLIRA